MAYYESFPSHKYISWNHDVVIIQEVRQQVANDEIKQETRLAINNKGVNIKSAIDWIPYPFKQGQNIVTVLEEKFPTLKTKADSILPFVELGLNRKLCSCYVLKDGTEIKQYMPINETINSYKKTRLRHDVLVLPTGERVLFVKPSDIVAILIK